MPLSVGLGLALALVLNRNIRLVGLYRVLFFVPFVISATAQGTLFSFVLDPEFGAANSVLYALGLPLMRRRRSSFINGISDDARAVIDHLARDLADRRTA